MVAAVAAALSAPALASLPGECLETCGVMPGPTRSLASSLVTVRASRVARSSEAMTQELRRLCRLFAERAQEGGEQTGLGRTW